MTTVSAVRSNLRILCALAIAGCLYAQTPAGVKEVQGLPPRAAPADYRAQAQAGKVTIAAEFTGHGIPNAQEPLKSEDFVAVEVGLFGSPGARLTIAASDFSIRINGRKPPLASQPWVLVAKDVKDPEWVSPEAAAPKSKGGISGSGGGSQEAGAPPPLPPKVPIEILRGWQQRLKKAALAEGDRVLPQAGLLFFPYRGKAESIRSAELIYQGPAGKATLGLQ